jgi:uncharacterized protein
MFDADALEVTEVEVPSVLAIETAVTKPEPVTAGERVASVDVLRGVALLGILAMNIVFFSWPEDAYTNPTRGGGDTGLNLFIWAFNHLVFDVKMMSIFSMLFGAGLVLMGERADARGKSLVWIYYRRVLWLLVIGALHAYLLWSGDILVLYAQCGLLLYPFRHLRARTLVILGVLALSVVILLGAAVGAGVSFLEAAAARAQATKESGEEPKKFDAWIETIWTTKILPELRPSPEKLAERSEKEIKAHRDGGYLRIVQHNAPQLLATHTIVFVIFLVWEISGRMLLGMGLMKLGVFSAARSRSFYGWMIALGYGLGLPLVAYDTCLLLIHNFEFPHSLRSMFLFNHIGSILVALGHVGVVMMICKSGALPWLTRRLAAVGRMALSNYLMHSLICTTLFYGYGFALYGKLDRTWLALIVLAIWTLQLLISPLWLARYRFGPAEWVWRSLTYWRLQPMRREVPALG